MLVSVTFIIRVLCLIRSDLFFPQGKADGTLEWVPQSQLQGLLNDTKWAKLIIFLTNKYSESIMGHDFTGNKIN